MAGRRGSDRLLEESERRRQTAEALAALATQTSAAQSLEVILARVLEYAETLVAADVTYLALREPGAEAAPIAVARGHRHPDFATVKLRPGQGVSGQVMLGGRPFRTADYLADARISHDLDGLIRAEAVTAVLAVPVYVNAQVAGVLWAGRRRAPPFTDEEERVLGQLAAQTAVALGNLWLYREAQAAQRRFQDLVQGLDAIVWEADAATRQFTFVSRHAELLLGYPVARWLTEPDFFAGLIHPEDREWAVARARAASEAGRDDDFECRVVAADGRVVWLRNMVRAVKSAEGRVGQLRGVMLDITGQVQAAAALRESEARLQAILDYSPAMIYVKDTAGRYLLVNRQFEVLVRLGPDPVVGRTDHELFPRAVAEAFRGNDLKVIEAGMPLEFEELAPHRDGLHTSITIKFPLTDATGAVYAVCGISTDITARKEAEEALRQSEARLRQVQKLEAVGRLAGGIAHDFNNILTVIAGYAEVLVGRLAGDERLRRDAAEIKNAANRAASLTRQLLAFGRGQVLQPRVLDLNAVVADLKTMLGPLIGAHIEVGTRPDPDLGRVRADPSQLEQVIVNLVLNARDAMPDGGRLLLETANVELDEAYVRSHEPARPGRYVRLAVSDTGSGMDAATQARVFEPFFTTKEPGKGTGLGLATVYGIVKQSGGYIWVYSEAGRGTTFKIYLPRVDETPDEPEANGRGTMPAGGSETILLVEDDGAVRSLARRTLEEAGYRVLEARDGHEGLVLAEAHREPIALVLTDLVMPGVGGLAMVKALAAIRPGVKTLYVSGYTDAAMLQQRVLEPGAAFLGKPFTRAELLRKVRDTLDSVADDGRR